MGFPTLHTSSRSAEVTLPAAAAWEVVASGRRGPRWYVEAAPFVFRGAIDRLVGGAGRAWEPPGTPVLDAGDTAGFWRVLEAGAYDGGHRLALEATVRAPGRVLLEARVEPSAASDGRSRSRVELRISFEPDGWLGRAYLLADLPAREAVVELTHRRLLADLRGQSR